MKENNPQETVNFIVHSGIVPVFYNHDEEVCRQVVQSCYQAGLRVFEFTNRGEVALANFKSIRKFIDSDCSDMQLGAGTIFNSSTAEKFIAAGADFIVSPAFVPAMNMVQREYCKLWIPGCATVSELAHARDAGAMMMKIFPGDVLGPKFISSVLSVMPELKLMPTGGAEPTRESLTAWFQSGVVAVGMGSQLFPNELIVKKNWQGLTIRIMEALILVSDIKSKK